MKKLFTLVGSILMAGAINATTLPAATSDEITSQLALAVDGDIIELTAETYTTATFTIAKKITVKASSSLTAAPVLTGISFTMNTGGALEIDGLELDGNALSYMIQATSTPDAAEEYIRIKNSKIFNYARSVLRSDNVTNYAVIGELTVDNCNISGIGAGSPGYSIFAVKTARITTISITNTTFSNCSNGICYSEQSTVPMTFTMQNTTIYNCGAVAAKSIIYFVANPSSNYTIDKTIMWGVFDAAYVGAAISIGAPTGGTTNLTSSIINVNATALSATFTTDTRITDVTTFSLDANLKITASQTLKDLYDLGTVVGDPRGYPMTVAVPTGTKYTNANSLIKVNGNNIEFNQASDVEVYSLTGQQVVNAKNINNLSTSSLNKGIYLVKASAQGISENIKIAVK